MTIPLFISRKDDRISDSSVVRVGFPLYMLDLFTLHMGKRYSVTAKPCHENLRQIQGCEIDEQKSCNYRYFDKRFITSSYSDLTDFNSEVKLEIMDSIASSRKESLDIP